MFAVNTLLDIKDIKRQNLNYDSIISLVNACKSALEAQCKIYKNTEDSEFFEAWLLVAASMLFTFIQGRENSVDIVECHGEVSKLLNQFIEQGEPERFLN